MARTVGIGHQNFEKLITNDYFYIDKTNFIKEWCKYVFAFEDKKVLIG